jgi:YVTN family beta-propeller protein
MRPAGPKVLAFAMALLLGATAGYSQWLETKITLPDSLGGALYPTCLTTDTSERYVYIGDHGLEGPRGGGVYIVDAEARTRVAKIPFGFISAVCTNTRRNKVYAADYVGNRVFVISCATNQLVATIPTGANPLALCYNSIDDKIYAANADGHDLTVIDCASDNVIKTVRFGGSPAELCYNPAGNRVFCKLSDTLVVIDGASDSVVAAYAGTWHGPIVVNAVANRVYLAGIIAGDAGLFVLDGTSGAVLDSLDDWPDVMCLNSHTQKLYTGNSDGRDFRVYDCTADTLIGRSHLHGQLDIYSMVCDTATGKVYAACNRLLVMTLVVIDGVTDTIAAKVPGPSQGELLVSARRGYLYSTDGEGPGLAVFDTGTDRPLRTIMIGGSTARMCYDSTDDKVYYVSYSILGEVGAIDAATNQPVGQVQVGPYPTSIVWHAPTNRVYCGGTSDVTVIDPTADTVTRVLTVQGDRLCSAPRVNKVYAFSPSDMEIAVIDCRNDSVVRTIPIGTNEMWYMCNVSTAGYDKLYISTYDAVLIVDCIGDTLVRSYFVGYNRIAVGRDGKRVHCATMNSLSTFDPAGDTLVASVPWEAVGLFALLYAPGVDKVYCAAPAGGQNCILVADGATDSLIAQIPLRLPTSLGYDSVSKLVYIGCPGAGDSLITFVDSRTDSIVGSLNSQVIPTAFTVVSPHSRVYVGPGRSFSKSVMPVIRTDPPGVEEAALSLTPKRSVGPTIVSRSAPWPGARCST